jgi:hypothetical protein
LPSNMNGYEYVYGSTARKMPENDPYVEKRIHRKKIRVKKYQKSKRKAIFTAVLLFAVVMFVMVRYSMILHLNYEIDMSAVLNGVIQFKSNLRRIPYI